MTAQLQNPLHLYRALLRETSYLFDHNVRQWTYGYVRSSFRRNAGGKQNGMEVKNIAWDPSHIPSHQERRSIKRARRFLVLVRRANEGYVRNLRNLTQLAYGRKGRLKRELTAPFLSLDKQETPVSTASDQGEQGSKHELKEKPKNFSKEWRPSEQFLSLLGAQSQLASYLSIKRQVKLKPVIEAKSKSGRPMPPSRIKNITKKWYANMAKCFMPPLPEREWERLKAIATREQEFTIPSRRPTAKRLTQSKQDEDAESTAKTVLAGVVKPRGFLMAVSVKQPHRLTPRYLSRFYAAHILNHTPHVMHDPNGRGLVSKWDNGKRNVVAPDKVKDDAQLQALFG